MELAAVGGSWSWGRAWTPPPPPAGSMEGMAALVAGRVAVAALVKPTVATLNCLVRDGLRDVTVHMLLGLGDNTFDGE